MFLGQLFSGKLFQGGLFRGSLFGAGGSDPLAALITALFGNDEQGGLWLPGPETCFTDDGITLCTAPGDLVYRMNDLSGRGNHAIQVAEAARPALQQTAGGLWYLAFDGTDDRLILPNIPFSSDTGVEVYAGVDTTNLGINYRVLITRSSSNTVYSFSAYLGSNVSYRPAIFDSGDQAVNVATQGLYVGAWRGSLLSGVTRRAITRVNRNQVSSDYTRTLATDEVLKSISSNSQIPKFDLYGLAIRCAPLLSDTVRDQTEVFMADRIGITLP